MQSPTRSMTNHAANPGFMPVTAGHNPGLTLWLPSAIGYT